jgi:oligopeptidase A
LSEYSTEISQNHALYEGYRSIRESGEFDRLSPAQQKTISDALLHFRLGGVELEAADREHYQLLQKDLSELQSSFENNLLDSTQAWEYVTEDEYELRGLPDYALAMLRQLAEQKKIPGYRVTLDMPCYLAVITYADNRQLRKSIYEAYVTRASDCGITDKIWDNAANMRQIVAKRQRTMPSTRSKPRWLPRSTRWSNFSTIWQSDRAKPLSTKSLNARHLPNRSDSKVI